MHDKSTIIIAGVLIILAISIAIIVIYFITFKEVENSIEITRFLPYNTPLFLGIDNISAQFKKMEYSQTRSGFKKSGFYNNLDKIVQITDVKVKEKTGLQLREWAQYIEKDAAIGVDSVNNKLVFIFAARIRNEKSNYKQTLLRFVFASRNILVQSKEYESISYDVSSRGYVVSFYRNILLISNDEEYFRNVCEVIVKKQENLAHNRSFLRLQEKLEYVGGILGFIDVKFLVRKPFAFHQLIKEINYLVNVGILKYAGYYNSVAGWESLDMIGMSGYIAGEEVVQKTFLLLSDSKREGIIASALKLKTEKLDVDKAISNEFSDFIIASIGDAGQFYDDIEDNIMKASSKKNQLKFIIVTGLLRGYGFDLRNDFVDALGDQAALVFALEELYKLREGIPPENIDLVVIAKIKNIAKINSFLEKAKKAFLDHAMNLSETNFAGDMIYSLNVREENNMRVVYGKNKDYFFISTNEDMMKKSIEAANGNDSIVKDKEYANCKSRFGPKSNFIFVSRDMLGKRLLARDEFSEIGDSHLKESVELAFNDIQSIMWKACGQMSSGVNSRDGLMIQTYYPLSYIYMVFIGAASGLMSNI